MAHSPDVDADPDVLPGAVTIPSVARLDQDGGCVVGHVVDALDASAELARGPQGIDQLEVVVGE